MNYRRGHYTLTKLVDQEALTDEMIAAGVTLGISIAGGVVTLDGFTTQEALVTQLAAVAAVEVAHVPRTLTVATLSAAPHVKALHDECVACDGVAALAVAYPESYPGDLVLNHAPLTAEQQATLKAVAEAHDASVVPRLTVGQGEEDQVFAADGVATGSVTATDSRGADAAGKVVRLVIPQGGSAGVNGDAFTLDANGQAVIGFLETTTYTASLEFKLYYENGEADPVTFKVRRGT